MGVWGEGVHVATKVCKLAVALCGYIIWIKSSVIEKRACNCNISPIYLPNFKSVAEQYYF